MNFQNSGLGLGLSTGGTCGALRNPSARLNPQASHQHYVGSPRVWHVGWMRTPREAFSFISSAGAAFEGQHHGSHADQCPRGRGSSLLSIHSPQPKGQHGRESGLMPGRVRHWLWSGP